MSVDLPPEAVDAPADLRRPLQQDERQARPPQPRRRRMPGWLLAILAAVAVAWSLRGTGVGITALAEGRSSAARLVSGFFPPDLGGDLLGRVAQAVAETFQISIAGLFFGAVLGLPLGLLIAGNVGAPRWLSNSARVVAAAFRGVPELLWALLFVATVGLGPAAGVYAITLHAAGLLAKLGAEQLEAVNPAPVEAMRLTGAAQPSTTFLAIIPQARNGLASLLLYQWECNIRSSAIVGFVGAGGIGQALSIALRLFRYQELATLLLVVLVVILGVDRLSRAIRGGMGAAT